MFTQCPECDVAFRVTAEVLRQAAGKVRCGRCGEAFNALEYLSEDKPVTRPPPEPEPDLPELEPEPGAGDDLEAEPPPRFISAEQSAALLKTLDELAGEDIRIEDTGVEWRVVTDEDDDEAERFDAPGSGDPQHDADPGADREMRFDDDTPLPDDFDFEAEPAVRPEPSDGTPAPPADDESFGQADLALGDPGEWEDLLDEVADDADTADDDVAAVAGDADPVAAHEEDAVAGADDAGDPAAAGDAIDNAMPADRDETGDSSIEEDLIAAAFETEAAARESAATESSDEPGAIAGEAGGDDPAFIVDLPEHELEADAPELADDLPHEEIPSEVELELEAREGEVRARLEGVGAGADSPADGLADADADPHGDPDIELNIDASDAARPGALDLPEMSEEEKTINMMIDQDLLAMAVTDEDGFASTIVQKQSASDEVRDDAGPEAAVTEVPAAGPVPASRLVETIIMEGESFRGEDDEAPGAAASVELPPADADADAGGAAHGRQRFGLAAGVALLVLLLVVQVVHYSREALATVPALNEAIGPLYRALGRPVSPDWDVSGWRFEATKGSADDDGERLTIYSRIGNTSDRPLPLPLVRVSLTDRYQEVIGSRIVEPARYLVGDADPRETVAPGQNFNAVIGIEAPAPEATGFTLNVCYRLADDKLKCAIEDFK